MAIIYLLISIGLIIFLTNNLKLHPFLALLASALLFGFLSGMPYDLIIKSINDGFGVTLGKIGLVIVLGIFIGVFLEQTGAAYKLAQVVLRLIGKKRVYGAMGLIGFIVSIPVFADSGFIILSPLNKSLSKQAKISIVGTATVLMLGLLITHVFVPPTPGPIAAAGIVKADIGLVMLLGLIIGLISLIIAIIFSKRIASKMYVDPNPEITEEEITKKIKNAPGPIKSFLPILVPILLIVNKSILEFTFADSESGIIELFVFLGTPVIALIAGLLLALLLPKKLDREMLSTTGWIGKAMKDSASILLITGAGGIFGTILQNSGIADSLTETLSIANLGIWLPFILCAAIKTAQGSSTVALITTASIVAPLLHTLGLDSEMQRALIVIAIGAGAMVVCHANDSGFWVMTQMSGMDVKTGYRSYTLGTFIVGCTAAILVYIASLIF